MQLCRNRHEGKIRASAVVLVDESKGLVTFFGEHGVEI